MEDFHPELRRMARRLPRTVITKRSLPVIRKLSKAMDRKPAAKDVDVLTLSSGIGVRLHRPTGVTGPGPALLWIHGGGYVIGSPSQDDDTCRKLANQLGVTVAAVKYRLAPEHPYPAALDDCHDALVWLASLPAVDRTRIAIAGASAGGGLAAALALAARNRGQVDVAAQVLVYPMLDDRSGRQAGLDSPNHRLWTQASNVFGWASYLGGADPESAVPARRTDLAGLPPTWIGVGTLDLFHDEDLAYAERLRTAGVPCDLEVVQGAFHGFDGLAPKAAVTRSFVASQVDFLRRNLTQKESAEA